MPAEAILLEQASAVDYNAVMQTAALDNVSIVLVDTKAPGNIGASARSMMNMGISRLVLVRPPEDRNDEARRFSAGADAVLDGAEVHSTLAGALHDQNLVFGASRHRGKLRRNVTNPREAAAEIVPLLAGNRVSIVFGNEVNGLENDDLMLCSGIIAIPSSERFASLNLSHAVMIIAYELFVAATGRFSGAQRKLAPHEDLELFYAHLQQSLEATGFLDPEHPDRMMYSLRQLFGRARPDAREVQMLRGILHALGNPR